MFVITLSALWSLSYFFLFSYIVVIFSMILYLIPTIKDIVYFSRFKNNSGFDYLTGFDIYWILLSPLMLMLLVNFSWSSYTVSAWFGNLIFTSFQWKIFYLVLFFFTLVISAYCSSFYFSSKDIYDYILINFNFFFWLLFLFSANTIFTVIFFVEVLSTLVFLLIITSTFSTTYFYNNLNLNLHSYFNSTTPFFFVQILMYFFWLSLVSSLNLFFFLVLFYTRFLTFDWFLFEFIFLYVAELNQFKDLFFLGLIWFNFLFCVFLKCGLVPFYFWKPTFFKGVPTHALFFYILFFYFFIFLFFLFFFLAYVNEIFYFFININVLLLLLGFFILIFVLCEAYYLKAFLALSSILNTLFVFLSLNALNISDFCFNL